CFSFQKYKNLPGGEAGGVVTDDEKLYRHSYGFHSHYRTPPNEGSFDPSEGRNGINLRMSEFQGSVLMSQLPRIEKNASRREATAAALDELIQDVPGITPVKMYPGCTRNAYHLYMMRYSPAAFAGLSRERFLKAMNAEGIPISNGYGRLNHEPFLENTFQSRAFRAVYTTKEINRWKERNHTPVNDLVAKEAIWLSQPELLGGEADAQDIALAMKKVQNHAAELKQG
ncbi:MAG: DegT/DnrJ/EryC1/StrS family aminotransferase, partial [bacterium]|nr:DegT/DnrJ/EryC1/StrS family aminotransferase [bacterium]